ncbi:MAG: hypothetical protein PHF86_08965 [Candidatus Nanoarchaeia archaeon]|nr:hypothetical protein [Candidatus Nanoarchaeia archaeon]
MDYKKEIPKFDLRNNLLSSLASCAAIDLDIYPEVCNDESSTEYLSELLNRITLGEDPEINRLDNSVILGYAISGRKEFEEYWKGKSKDDLVLQVNLVAKDLRNIQNLSGEKRKTLSEFCVNLSREISYHQDQYYSGSSYLAA